MADHTQLEAKIKKMEGEIASLALVVEIMGKHLAKMLMEKKQEEVYNA